MRRLTAACVILLITLAGCSWAEREPNQFVTTSWDGLTGMFVAPTARMMGKGRIAFGFNEAKHTEFVKTVRSVDRQIRGVVTYGLTDWFEVSASYYNDILAVPRLPILDNQAFTEFGFKVRVMEESTTHWFPEFSIAVRDLTNDSSDVGSLDYIHNGTKVFLLASKKVFKKSETGRFLDAHFGLTFDHNTVSGLVGFELTLAPNASLISEWIWDSPFINFRDYGENDVPGRFVFDPGIRFYPEMVPGLALDLGFIGDSEFEFSFGASYRVQL